MRVSLLQPGDGGALLGGKCPAIDDGLQDTDADHGSHEAGPEQRTEGQCRAVETGIEGYLRQLVQDAFVTN